jgi:microcystin-dependent protein
MMPYIGEIRAFAFGYAPSCWIPCDGRMLTIDDFSPLFVVIRNVYGGDGETTFAIPDLRGAALAGQGLGPGLSPYAIPEVVGQCEVTLTMDQLPAHTHTARAKVNASGVANMHGAPQPGDQLSRLAPVGVVGSAFNTPPLTNPASFAPEMVQAAGGGQAHDNQQPYLAMMYCIAAIGLVPVPPDGSSNGQRR